MISLQLSSLSRLIAMAEILILLIIFALIGWLIAYLSIARPMRVLKKNIKNTAIELARCSLHKVDYINSHPSFARISSPVSMGIQSNDFTCSGGEIDDLTLIEGISPKVKELLCKADIRDFSTLSATTELQLSTILKKAGAHFQMHDPSSWPMQALLAKEQRWYDLKLLQDKLIAGRS